MVIKALEMHGFKSFPDKIKLVFDTGLTAVVGPNGSGKSNISDAMRWVLGEQSTKTLRGNKMEDIIFSGTLTRKPMGYAMVSLYIDNADRGLKQDTDEVCITRKLYRSGDSEYLINGKQSRLKDISELFMDTGMGRDGYSIIGQGRIAEIVSAKSNDRRDIFDEAAGISKFRHKKADAERRLKLAEENIVRLDDIIKELESRLEPLKIQSEKAEKFTRLAETRKTLELGIWVRELDSIKQKLDEFDNNILANTAEYDSIVADIEECEKRITDGYSDMQKCTISISDLQKRILETERSSSDKRALIAVMENDIIHARDSVAEMQKKAEDEARVRENLNDNVAQKQESLVALKMDFEDCNAYVEKSALKLAKLQGEIQIASEKNDELSREINSLQMKKSEVGFVLNASKNSRDEAIRQLESTYSDDDLSKNKKKSLLEEMQGIEENIAKADELHEEHINAGNGYKRLYIAKSQKLTGEKDRFSELNLALNGKKSRLNILSDLEKNMEGFNYSVKEILRAKRNSAIIGIKGTVAEVISVESPYATAIETALGAGLQNIIVENEDTAKRCIRLLKEKNAGRATFLPITSVKSSFTPNKSLYSEAGFIAYACELVEIADEYKGIINQLLGRIVIADDLDSATIIAKNYNYKFKIVTLDGQVINAGGSFTGGSQNRSSGVLTRKNEINSLSCELEGIYNEQTHLKDRIAVLQAEVTKLSFDIEGENEQASLLVNEKIRLEGEKSRCSAMLDEMEKLIDTQLEYRKSLEEKTANIDKKSEEMTILLGEIESKLAIISDEFGSISQNLQNLRDDLSETTRLNSQHLFKRIELSKDIEGLGKEIEQMVFSQLNSDKMQEDLECEINAQLDIIEQKKLGIKGANKALDGYDDDIISLNKEISRQQVAHREFEAKITSLRSSLKDKNDAKDKFSREISRLEERKSSTQKEFDAIVSELWENYEMLRSEAQQYVFEKFIEVDDLELKKRELSEIKANIKALGNVNVGAIDEYREVNERYKFMSEQIEDILKSKRELLRHIEDLTENMKRIFTETFNSINENFQNIFIELFGGGNARLVLSEPSDVLQSGIEIEVAPPGKVIKNLVSLSGGEQSFVAIAIYFAILKIKPSPFCILDEIEAALDEVNVQKFASYLGKFVDTTQFIAVTHRRGTMEAAKVLYGVTMQEKGVSRILYLDQPKYESLSKDK